MEAGSNSISFLDKPPFTSPHDPNIPERGEFANHSSTDDKLFRPSSGLENSIYIVFKK